MTDLDAITANRDSPNIFCRLAARLLSFITPRADFPVIRGIPTWNRPRSAPRWNPTVIQNVKQIGQAPVLLTAANPDRLEVWIKNDATNGGNLNLTTASGQFFWPIEPGVTIVIDTCYDAIYGVFDVGASGNVRVNEILEHG